jgi:hypothetical protein
MGRGLTQIFTDKDVLVSPGGGECRATKDAMSHWLASPKGFEVYLFLFESFFEKKQISEICANPRKSVSQKKIIRSHQNLDVLAPLREKIYLRGGLTCIKFF